MIIPVLKANAYGHGLLEIATILEYSKHEFPRVAVDSYKEALEIRKSSELRPLVMGPVLESNIARVKTDGVAFVAQNLSVLKAWAKSGRPVTLHIEFDTGMKRHGLSESDLQNAINIINQSPNIAIEGVMTHLADADNPKSDKFVLEQYERFKVIVDKIKAKGIKPKIIHVQQSGGVTRDNLQTTNTVRPGIALYGISPLDTSDSKHRQYKQLQPVLEFRSKVSALQKLEPEETVSYSRTYKAKKNEEIAIIPVGYYEALPRSLSNTGVLLDSKRNKLNIRGRVCMNHTMIDATKNKLKVGDEVTVISRDPKAPNSIQGICDASGSFNYELMVNIDQSTRRQVVD